MQRLTASFARYTWRRQLPAEALLGASWAVVELAGFAAKRSLGAPDWVVPAILMAAQIPWLLAPAWEVAFARTDPRRVFLWVGGIAKAPLLLIAFVAAAPVVAGSTVRATSDTLWLFLVAVALHHVMNGAYLPHRGGLLRANYAGPIRGRMYSHLEIVGMLAFLVATKAGGVLLDRDDASLRIVFPAAAAIGFAGYLCLARIRWRRDGQLAAPALEGPRALGAALLRSWRNSLRVLGENPDFRLYEVGYMLYGIAFLSSLPLVTLFGEGPLALSYNEWADARGIAFPVAFVAGAYLFGRLVDRVGPIRVTAVGFTLLALFFGLVPLAQTAGHLFAAFLLFGVAMAGVTSGWTLGPLHFAPPGRARAYASVHVFLVGVRSAPGPLLGYALATWVSLTFAFVVSSALAACGVVAMLVLWRREAASGRALTI